MKYNNKTYKRLGDYIEQVNVRNSELLDVPLLGINIDKHFMPSVANIIGTDLSRYKLVHKNQFACNRMHVGRDNRIPIAISESDTPFMVSPAYDVFRIIDESLLNPHYLMMWFQRKEFDRECTFYTDADVRLGLPRDSFEDLRIKIPSIEEQQKIVSEYQAIENKIKVNEQICEKLEATAQAIYREWFVEFNFPDENGKPYKDNGGKMVWNEELEKDVPEGWEVVKFERIIEISSGKSVIDKSNLKTKNYKYPIFGAGGVMGYSREYLLNEKLLSIGRVGTHGIVQRIDYHCWLSDNTLVIKTNNYEYVYHILLEINYDEINRGGVQGLITQTDVKNLKVLLPKTMVLDSFERVSSTIFGVHVLRLQENQILLELQSLLLARMVK